MRVLLSHNAPTDGEFVEKLAEHLWTIGVEPRRDNLKSPLAEKNPDRLDQELRKYDFFLPILSASYMKDRWLQIELLQGLLRERAEKLPFVIPVQVGNCRIPPLLQGRVVDFRSIPFEEAFAKLVPSFAGPRQVFVIMKFGDPRLDSMYHLVIKPLAEEFGLSALRIDEVKDSGMVTDQILKHIEKSAIILADLTGERPNCYYETGYAHALGRDLILTIQRESAIHFDLAGYRFIQWSTEKELMDALRPRFAAIMEKHRLSNAHSLPQKALKKRAPKKGSPNSGAPPDTNRASRGRRR
jgi:nucleoside 2-deoxyribosyltransferase